METSLNRWNFLRATDPNAAGPAVFGYMDRTAKVVLYEYGTALLSDPGTMDEDAARQAMSALSHRRDFDVLRMKDGNIIVWLANNVCVFLSASEVSEILECVKALPTSPDPLGRESGEMPEDMIIGLAGREKAHRDAVSQKRVLVLQP